MQTQLRINPRQPAKRRARTAHVAAVTAALPDAAADSSSPSGTAASATAPRQQQQDSKRSRKQLPQVVQASSQGVYVGRLLIKEQPAAGYGSLPGSLKEVGSAHPAGSCCCLPRKVYHPEAQPVCGLLLWLL